MRLILRLNSPGRLIQAQNFDGVLECESNLEIYGPCQLLSRYISSLCQSSTIQTNFPWLTAGQADLNTMLHDEINRCLASLIDQGRWCPGRSVQPHQLLSMQEVHMPTYAARHLATLNQGCSSLAVSGRPAPGVDPGLLPWAYMQTRPRRGAKSTFL